jgi:ABC-type amino acid transport substrate-binding protein
MAVQGMGATQAVFPAGKYIQRAFFCLVLWLALGTVHADTYSCGLSDGYPPYQFVSQDNETAGFDADVLRLVFSRLQSQIDFHQMNWDDAVALLRLTNRFDCVGGMEITPVREHLFEFTRPYYERNIVIFVLAANDQITGVEDLIGKKITGDRHSSLEQMLERQGVRDKIRIKETKTKEESMRLLKSGDSRAMMAPRAVGYYLAKQFNVKVRVLIESDRPSPVAIAVRKGTLTQPARVSIL